MAKKETETSGSKKKRYYFLKLPADHHKTPMMERLIHRLGNEGYGLYLRLLEMTVSNTGFLKFDHVENTIEGQIAFDLRITDDQAGELIGTLEKLGLVERIEENPEEDDPGGLLFKEGALYTADETPEAARQRLYRERHKIPPNEPESGQALQCNGEVLQSDDNKNKSKNENSELEQEARIRPLASNEVNSYSLGENPAAACAGAAGAAPPPPASSPFLEKTRKLNGKKKTHRLTEAGLEAFAKETNEGAELWGKPIEPDGLPKALNGWAKKMSEKGEHPEFFDDGAGQNAAAPGGAGSNEAGNSTSAETAAKEKELKKRIAELVKECKRIEAAPREKVRGLCCYEEAGDCHNCAGPEGDCGDYFRDYVWGKVSDLAQKILGGKEAIQFFCPISIITLDEIKEYAANYEHVYFPKAGTIVLDDPYYKLDEILALNSDEWEGDEDAEELKKYYSDKPFHGIPEAIARHELNMPLPHEANLIKRAEEEPQRQARALEEYMKKWEEENRKNENADL